MASWTISLAGTANVFSKDIGMVFGPKKRAVLSLKGEKLVNFDSISIPDDELMRVAEEEVYPYFGLKNFLNKQ